MPEWIIRNCYLDHGKVHLHRVAVKLETEPLVGGVRLRIRESRKVSQEYVERNHAMLENLVKSGVIEMTAPSGETVDAADMKSNPDTLDQVQAEVAVAPSPAPLPEDVGPYDLPPEGVVAEAPMSPTPEPQRRGRWKNKG